MNVERIAFRLYSGKLQQCDVLESVEIDGVVYFRVKVASMKTMHTFLVPCVLCVSC